MSSPRSPGLSGTGSTSRLVLLPDTDTRDPLEEYATDDEDEDEDNDLHPEITQLSLPSLSPPVVFLYLLAPYLRLGAIRTPEIGATSFLHGLAGLVVAAFLSSFCRQIWFLLGRYLRKSSAEDMLIHTFAPRHRRARMYGMVCYTFIIISELFRLLLAAMYLRDSVDSALLLQVPETILFRSRFNISILLSILVYVLSLPKSLASRSVVYTTGLSVASYLVWLIVVSWSYGANQLSLPKLSSTQRGVLWSETSSFTFACTTIMTVPLSTSLVAGASDSPASKNARMSLFQLLNVSSTMLAVLFMFPLAVIAASPRAPAATAVSDNLILGLRIATLVLSIPSLVVPMISLPPHGVVYPFIHTNTALFVITVVVLTLNLVSPNVASILDDAILVLAVFGTFLLPALTHIIVHYFRRPLSIVVPHAPSLTPGYSRRSNSERSPSPSRDPLLQRKERLLQRSRFAKRLSLDLVIWVILIPTCGCALVWAAGRLTGQW